MRPAPGWDVFFAGRQEEDHACCYHHVPYGVSVEVVNVGLCEDVHAHSDDCRQDARQQEQDPATP